MHDIKKYPRTPHLVGSKLQAGDSTDGQVPVESLTEGELVWEEKLDGGNSGISYSEDLEQLLQSRGHYLTGGAREAQFAPLKAWASTNNDELFDLLGIRYIAYGEWCFAKHTVFYDALPAYFMEFDVYDKETGRYLDTDTRHRMFAGSCITSVPVVHRGMIRSRDVRKLVKPSLYKTANWRDALRKAAAHAGVDPEQAVRETEYSDLSEGLYLKQEKDGEVIGRFKFVRKDFLQTILDSGSHWSARTIIANGLA